MAFDYAIVLTGSIATGKSTVASYFQNSGFEMIDADKIAHQTLEEEKYNIVKCFPEMELVDDKLDRKRLGNIVFANPEKRKILEDLLHPLIYNKIFARANILDTYQKPYLIDIPLFFESKRYTIEKSIVVYTPKDIQIKRLMQRDGMSVDEAESRINMQIDIEIKKRDASYVIDNSGDKLALYQACEECKLWIEGVF